MARPLPNVELFSDVTLAFATWMKATGEKRQWEHGPCSAFAGYEASHGSAAILAPRPNDAKRNQSRRWFGGTRLARQFMPPAFATDLLSSLFKRDFRFIVIPNAARRAAVLCWPGTGRCTIMPDHGSEPTLRRFMPQRVRDDEK